MFSKKLFSLVLVAALVAPLSAAAEEFESASNEIEIENSELGEQKLNKMAPRFSEYSDREQLTILSADEQKARKMREVLTQDISVHVGMLRAEAVDLSAKEQQEMQEITEKMTDLRQLQREAFRADTVEKKTDTAKKMYRELEELKFEVEHLRKEMQADEENVIGLGSVLPLEEEGDYSEETDDDTASSVETARLLASLAALEAQLAERLAELEEVDPDIQPSLLESSLLSIERHPVAVGFVTIVAFGLIWLFRDRIAELSGFGLKIKFAGKKEE